MRDYEKELRERVAYIQELLKSSGSKGIVFGNSGGKDSALVGILCKKATEQVLAVCMPCQSKRNFGEDLDDAVALAAQFGIENIVVDLTAVKAAMLETIEETITVTDAASSNIAPRLRMTTLYTIGQSLGYLVAGTGNKSEYYMGYFTKWGDGASDFNPIADLTASEVFEFLAFLNGPESILHKAPSAGLFEGQTDEDEMGISYAAIDHFLYTGEATDEQKAILDRFHSRSEHKRRPVKTFETWMKEQA
jgi:NAD+ synthase